MDFHVSYFVYYYYYDYNYPLCNSHNGGVINSILWMRKPDLGNLSLSQAITLIVLPTYLHMRERKDYFRI